VIHRILVAVDDSPAALAAAGLAVRLASECGATLRLVTVVADAAVADRLRAELGSEPGDGLARRRAAAADAVLRHVARSAVQAGVQVQTVQVEGEPAARVLQQAGAWDADLIVVGRSDLPGAGQPYVGALTRQVLEFAEQPVLVVPPPKDQVASTSTATT
jgi:nucleotide-binding universal stress UspA family protein